MSASQGSKYSQETIISGISRDAFDGSDSGTKGVSRRGRRGYDDSEPI